jgi:hypothetical protein
MTLQPLESFLYEIARAYCTDSLDSVENVMSNRILDWGIILMRMRAIDWPEKEEFGVVQNHINCLIDGIYHLQKLRDENGNGKART